MKLLSDQNLAPRLADCLADLYPGSAHVYQMGLDRASDLDVWNVARDQGYAIASQDADFADLSALFGFPPKVIWIRRGNRSTREIEGVLRLHYETVTSLDADPSVGILALF